MCDFPFSEILLKAVLSAFNSKFKSKFQFEITAAELFACIFTTSEEVCINLLFWFEDRVDGSSLVDSHTPNLLLSYQDIIYLKGIWYSLFSVSLHMLFASGSHLLMSFLLPNNTSYDARKFHFGKEYKNKELQFEK